MTTTTNHPSRIPEQEPTSPTAVVLCDGEAWAKTGADWESPRELCSWGDLRVFAAERGGATLFDLSGMPTGLTGAQKGAVRSMWRATEGFAETTDEADNLCALFPEAFPDDLVTATWEYGDPDEKWADLLRVACMDGAHVVGTQSGVTYSGLVFAAHSDLIYIGCTTGMSALVIPRWGVDWTITVTAPKPADPTGGDPAVLANLANEAKKCVFFRAEDGKWAHVRGAIAGVWTTDSLFDVKRLSPQTIAELMGGDGNE